MINPWKHYAGRCDAVITRIESPDSYIPYVYVKTLDGRELSGPLKDCHTQWARLKVGARVGYAVRWSIVSDKPLITKLIVRKTKGIANV